MKDPRDILYHDLLFNLLKPLRLGNSPVPTTRGDTGLDLVHLTNLFLPRVIRVGEQVDETAVMQEIQRVADKHAERVGPYLDWRYGPKELPVSPKECEVIEVNEETAQMILERFHYLGSFRAGSKHIGLTFKDRVASMVSFSPFDMSHMEGLRGLQAVTLSRFYSFPWAPKNSTSYLISKGLESIQGDFPKTDIVVSYLDPNIGFDGSSYRASNFVLLGQEHGTSYAFLDGDFVTQRDLLRKFGTFDRRQIESKIGDRFQVSTIPLQPLDLYAYFIHKDTARAFDSSQLLRFEKPSSEKDYSGN